MLTIIILTIVGTGLFIGIVVYFIRASVKKDAWEGEVIDKREETSTGGDYDQTYYVLYIKATDGKQRRFPLRKKLWQQFNVGDKLIKPKGETVPRKV
jgi:hypothetical protein